jgi:DNA repair protein RecO (recombination protein O)
MITVDGLVISERPSGENSKSIILMTKEYACIKVFVRGGRKSNKSTSSTQLFCYAKFSLEEKTLANGNVRYFYNSSEPIRMFYNIRLDAKRTALAYYFGQLLKYTDPRDSTGGEVMRLTMNTYYFLDKGDRDMDLLKSIFEFRLMCEIGYRPNLIGCCNCYATEDEYMYFNIVKGRFYCTECIKTPNLRTCLKIDKTLFLIIQYIGLSEYEQLFNFRLSPKYLKKLKKFTEQFRDFYLEGSFTALGFYESL